MTKMKIKFDVKYLSHLRKYYRALQLFCSGMKDIYEYIAVSKDLEIVVPAGDAITNGTYKMNSESKSQQPSNNFVLIGSSSFVISTVNISTKFEQTPDVDDHLKSFQENRNKALRSAKKSLNELISIDTYLHTSAELDDNDGLAPPEVHVKNRAFFALGVHILELQGVVKVVEENFRR